MVRPIVEGPGNQTAPSISLGSIAYLDDASGDVAVKVAPLLGGAPFTVEPTGTDGVAQDWPRLSGNVVAYRNPDQVVVSGAVARPFTVEEAWGMGRTVLGPGVVGWEQLEAEARTGDTDVAWRRLSDPEGAFQQLRGGAGRQGAIAAADDWIGWVDFAVPGTLDAAGVGSAAGELHVVNTGALAGEATFRVPNHGVLGVDAVVELALWNPGRLGPPRMAVTVAPAGGAADDRQIVVLDSDGTFMARLSLPGKKVNPHLFGDFVGYEDLSFTNSQVRLWKWSAPPDPLPEIHAPDLSASEQKLHELVVSGRLQVVWSDRKPLGDFDIYLFEADLPLDPDVDPPAVPAQCDDANPTVIAELEVPRLTAKPEPLGTALTLLADTNVLVCLDAVDVTSAWVVAGTQVVAGPGDFGRGEQHREARLTLAAGQGGFGAVLAGKPGASIRMRLLVDAGENGDGASGSTCAATGDCPPPPKGLTKEAAPSGCASSGGYGTLTLLLLPAALLLSTRRRSRR